MLKIALENEAGAFARAFVRACVRSLAVISAYDTHLLTFCLVAFESLTPYRT